MAEYTLRAVFEDKLERKVFEATSNLQARRIAHNQLSALVDNVEPWHSGKLVLLDEGGVIIGRITNLREQLGCNCGECDECIDRAENW